MARDDRVEIELGGDPTTTRGGFLLRVGGGVVGGMVLGEVWSRPRRDLTTG